MLTHPPNQDVHVIQLIVNHHTVAIYVAADIIYIYIYIYIYIICMCVFVYIYVNEPVKTDLIYT